MGCLKLDIRNKTNPTLRVVGKNLTTPKSPIHDFFEQKKTEVDLSPFGVQLNERTFGADSSYKWSFQGQERDTEIFKSGSYNFKYRMSRPDLGRFFAIDPLYAKYPHYSTYSFSGNRVIDNIEFEGLENISLEMASRDPGLTKINVTRKETIEYQTSNAMLAGAIPLVVFTTVVTAPLTVPAIIKEIAEYAVEEVTGIPIINDPFDVGEAVIKRSGRKTASQGIEKVSKESTDKATKESIDNATKGVTKDSPVENINKSVDASSKDIQADGNIKNTNIRASKVEKTKKTEEIGGKYTKTTEVRPSKVQSGQSRAEYVRYKNRENKVIRTYKDSYDRSNKFQHRKPLRGGPEGRSIKD